VMVEEEQNDNKGLLPEEFEDLSSFVMEEDPDMYAAAACRVFYDMCNFSQI